MQLLISLIFCLAAALAPAAQAADPREAAIQGVIARQIEAFRRDDGAAAFAHASPMIQGLFGSPDRFMAMVRGGYPQVYGPRSYSFGPLRDLESGLYQLVDIEAADGSRVTAAYQMVEIDGVWRINGCQLLRPGIEV